MPVQRQTLIRPLELSQERVGEEIRYKETKDRELPRNLTEFFEEAFESKTDFQL